MRLFPESIGVRLRTGLRISFLALLFVALWLESAGFPCWLTELVTEKMSRGDYFIKASGMKLDMLSGLYFENIEIFRKRVVGPPAVKAGGMRIRFSPRAAIVENSTPVSSIEILDGTINPDFAFGPDSGQGGGVSSSVGIVLTRMTVKNLKIERLNADLTFGGSSLSLSNIVTSIGGDFGPGTVSGWFRQDFPGNFIEGRIITNLDPHLLVPELTSMQWDYTVELIDRFQWSGKKPLIDTVFSKAESESGSVFTSRSIFSMQDYTYRGVHNDSCNGYVSCTFDTTGAVVNVENIIITSGNGAVVGGFAYDMHSQQVSYRTVTDVHPADFFQMVGLWQPDEIESWKFPGKTKFVSEGFLDFKDWDNTILTAAADSYGMGFGRIIADRCTFNVSMHGSTCLVTDIEGSIWDGSLEGDAQINFDDKGDDYVSFSIGVTNCDFSKVAGNLCNTQTAGLSGVFSMQAQGGFIMSSNTLQTISAFGKANIDKGRLFQLPLFGGLTSIMTKIIPGLDFVLRQSDLNAEFKIENARITSDKIAIDGGVLSLKASGHATVEGELDYAVQLTLMSEDSSVAKVLRVLTWPISKLMEFRLRGSIEKPEWYPINFSSELLEKIGLMNRDADEQ